MTGRDLASAMNELEKVLADSQMETDNRRAESTRRRDEGRALYTVDGQPSLRLSFVIYLDELGTTTRLPLLTDEGLRADLKTYDRLRTLLHDNESVVEAESARVSTSATTSQSSRRSSLSRRGFSTTDSTANFSPSRPIS